MKKQILTDHPGLNRKLAEKRASEIMESEARDRALKRRQPMTEADNSFVQYKRTQNLSNGDSDCLLDDMVDKDDHHLYREKRAEKRFFSSDWTGAKEDCRAWAKMKKGTLDHKIHTLLFLCCLKLNNRQQAAAVIKKYFTYNGKQYKHHMALLQEAQIKNSSKRND